VFLLFAFPNYCDRCSYRDVAELFQVSRDAVSRPVGTPLPCCAAGENPAGDPKGRCGAPGGGNRHSPDGKNIDHARVPYCIGSTLSTVTIQSDILDEIRRTVAPEIFRAQETAFARLSPVLDHKESRAPPA
jgi:hypothetical protein